MNIKKETNEELILRLGVILDQIKACKKGLKDFPDNEQFQKAVPYFINEGKKVKQELERRNK